MADEEINLDLDEAVNYIISNKEKSPRDLNRARLKEVISSISESSLNGLPTEIIKRLCQVVIFKNCYDIPTRRRLLYSCIPMTSDFPYEIIPLAVSCATVPNLSSTWQTSIVTWLYGLLHYHVIDSSHRMVHVCYQPLFNMLNKFTTCGVVAMILHHVTCREDVTSYRVQILLRLRKKIAYGPLLTHLLSLYQVLRPDLIISRLDQGKRVPELPRALKEPFARARSRLEDQSSGGDEVRESDWPGTGVGRRANPFHAPAAVPLPEVLVYADTLEQKKQKMISVLQYKRVSDMASEVKLWRSWRWPNSAAALLWKPALIALFRPYDARLKVALTNWLECALRAEVIEQLGSPSLERREQLLDACRSLIRDTETLVPAVFHFLVEFFTKWDRYSHMPKILDLVSLVPYISPSVFCESVFESFSQILDTASLSLFCAVVDTFANTAVTWALQAHRELKGPHKDTQWPYHVGDVFPLEGVLFLSQRLERVFVAGVLRLGPHPLLLNTCISYYVKVNMCLEELSLPLLVGVPCDLFFFSLTSSNVVATHRLGHELVRLLKRAEEVKKCSVSGDAHVIKNNCLFQIPNINFCATVYLDSVVTSRGFNEKWRPVLSGFVGASSLRAAAASLPNLNRFASLLRALPYLPLAAKHRDALHSADHDADTSQMHDVVTLILDELVEADLDGIKACVSAYIR